MNTIQCALSWSRWAHVFTIPRTCLNGKSFPLWCHKGIRHILLRLVPAASFRCWLPTPLRNRPRYSSLARTVENQNSIFFCREAVNRGLNVLLPERLTVESLWQCNEVEGEKQNSLNLRHNTGFQTLSKYWFSIQFSILATTEVSSGEGGRGGMSIDISILQKSLIELFLVSNIDI